LFHHKRHPTELNERDIGAWLSYPATKRNVAASPQNQALSAVLFLYRNVLNVSLEWIVNIERAKRPARLPVVFPRHEVRAVLARLTETPWLMASLLYGSGLRLMECVRLRVKDVEFNQHQIVIREGKGGRDRVTMLPASLVEPLERHLSRVKVMHEQDLQAGYGRVFQPFALARKYPHAD